MIKRLVTSGTARDLRGLEEDEKEDEEGGREKLGWKDYLAFIIAAFQTILIPLVVFVIILVVIVLLLRF